MLTAVMFYTIIPVGNRPFADGMMGKSTRYYPLTGLLVAGIGVGVFLLASYTLPFMVAVALSMASTTFVTGAFHEDGMADSCDGFGGGYTRTRILEIMKDSRIGTFGATGLFFVLLIKFSALASLQPLCFPWVLMAAHGLSRVLPVVVIYSLNYARNDDGTSKIKSVSEKGSMGGLMVALFFGMAFLVFLPWKSVLLICVLLAVVYTIFVTYINKRIGGFTGDTLGALQQISEVVFYLGFLMKA